MALSYEEIWIETGLVVAGLRIPKVVGNKIFKSEDEDNE